MHDWRLIALLWCVGPCWGGEEVHNGTVPTAPAMRLELVENLRLAPQDGTDHLMWEGAFTAVDVDDQGRIYITDPGHERIWRFDASGRYVGPLEADFHNLASFQVLHNGLMVALENVQGPSRFTWFDAQGKILQRQRNTDSAKLLQFVRFAPDGEKMAAVYFKVDPRTGDRFVESVVMDADLNVTRTLTSRRLPPGDTSLPLREFWTNELSRHLAAGVDGLGIVVFADDGSVFTAVTDQYRITRYSPAMTDPTVFGRAFDPIPFGEDQRRASVPVIRGVAHAVISPSHRRYVTDDVVKGAIDHAGLGTEKHPIFALVPMPAGGLMVVHDVDLQQRTAHTDLFDGTGRFIGTHRFEDMVFTHFWANPTRMVFKKDQLYLLTQDAEQRPALVRYAWRLLPASGN